MQVASGTLGCPLQDMFYSPWAWLFGVNGSRVAGGNDRNRLDRAPYHKTALSWTNEEHFVLRDGGYFGFNPVLLSNSACKNSVIVRSAKVRRRPW